MTAQFFDMIRNRPKCPADPPADVGKDNQFKNSLVRLWVECLSVIVGLKHRPGGTFPTNYVKNGSIVGKSELHFGYNYISSRLGVYPYSWQVRGHRGQPDWTVFVEHPDQSGQVDPHEFKYPFATPYNAMFNNPISIVDPTEMDGEGSGDSTKSSNKAPSKEELKQNREDAKQITRTFNTGDQGEVYADLSQDLFDAFREAQENGEGFWGSVITAVAVVFGITIPENIQVQEGGEKSDYVDTKKKNADLSFNRETDKSKSEVEKTLKDNGFVQTPTSDPQVQNFTKGDTQYTTRTKSKTTPENDVLDYRNKSNGSKGKIRLKMK